MAPSTGVDVRSQFPGTSVKSGKRKSHGGGVSGRDATSAISSGIDDRDPYNLMLTPRFHEQERAAEDREVHVKPIPAKTLHRLFKEVMKEDREKRRISTLTGEERAEEKRREAELKAREHAELVARRRADATKTSEEFDRELQLGLPRFLSQINAELDRDERRAARHAPHKASKKLPQHNRQTPARRHQQKRESAPATLADTRSSALTMPAKDTEAIHAAGVDGDENCDENIPSSSTETAVPLHSSKLDNNPKPLPASILRTSPAVKNIDSDTLSQAGKHQLTSYKPSRSRSVAANDTIASATSATTEKLSSFNFTDEKPLQMKFGTALKMEPSKTENQQSLQLIGDGLTLGRSKARTASITSNEQRRNISATNSNSGSGIYNRERYRFPGWGNEAFGRHSSARSEPGSSRNHSGIGEYRLPMVHDEDSDLVIRFIPLSDPTETSSFSSSYIPPQHAPPGSQQTHTPLLISSLNSQRVQAISVSSTSPSQQYYIPPQFCQHSEPSRSSPSSCSARPAVSSGWLHSALSADQERMKSLRERFESDGPVRKKCETPPSLISRIGFSTVTRRSEDGTSPRSSDHYSLSHGARIEEENSRRKRAERPPFLDSPIVLSTTPTRSSNPGHEQGFERRWDRRSDHKSYWSFDKNIARTQEQSYESGLMSNHPRGPRRRFREPPMAG